MVFVDIQEQCVYKEYIEYRVYMYNSMIINKIIMKFNMIYTNKLSCKISWSCEQYIIIIQ